MRDYYQDGFDDRYPQADGDKYNYEQGLEDGDRRRIISDELTNEGH